MLKEILNALVYAFPDWAMLALAVLGWLRRRRKYKRSDGRREDARKRTSR